MNLSTFNFNRAPKALLIAVLIALLLEGVFHLTLMYVEWLYERGDMIAMDTDFFCRNYSKYAQKGPLRDKKYYPVEYSSWEEMGEAGPYDVVVFGSSVGNSGWVEMLNIDYGI